MHFLEAVTLIGVPVVAAGAALAWWAPQVMRQQVAPSVKTHPEGVDQLLADVRNLMFGYEEALLRVGEEVPEFMRPHIAALMTWNDSNLVIDEAAASSTSRGVALQMAIQATAGLRRALADLEAARNDHSSTGPMAQTACAKRLLNSTRQHFEGRTIELVNLMQLSPKVFDLNNTLALQGAK